jgi:hypothetical protein
MRCRRGLRGRVGFASRCAPIGPLATPRDPRAKLCPQAGRTGMTSARRGASPMPRRRVGAAAARRAHPGGVPPREPPGGTGGCVAARTWRRAVPEGISVKPRMGDGALRRCKGCARSGRHAECPVEMDAARRPRPGGWTGVRRRGLRTMGCAMSTGRRGAAAGARFQISHAHREAPRAPHPRRLTEDQRPIKIRCTSTGAIW